jgi:hypothetical protein
MWPPNLKTSKPNQTKPNQIKELESQIKEEQHTLRLAGGAVEPVDVENLELAESRPWRSRADGRRGGARATLVATDRRSAAMMMDKGIGSCCSSSLLARREENSRVESKKGLLGLA